MARTEYPNRDALQKALDLYLPAMSLFVKERLDPELIEKRLGPGYIAHLITKYWNTSFKEHFEATDFYEARGAAWLIVEGRNRVAHPQTEDSDLEFARTQLFLEDLDSEFTRTQLFLIAEILEKINMFDAQRKVEEIRDTLFPQDSPEHLAQVKRDLTSAKVENSRLRKALEETKVELSETSSALDETEAELQHALARLKVAEAEEEDLEEYLEIDQEETEIENDYDPSVGDPIRALAREMGTTYNKVQKALRAFYREASLEEIEKVSELKVAELQNAEGYMEAWEYYEAKRDANSE